MGDISAWSPRKRSVIHAYISAFVLDFSVASGDVAYGDYLYGRGQPQGPIIERLFKEVDLWFDRLRTWIEAITDQDADPWDPLNPVSVPGNGLAIIASESGIISLPASAHSIVVTFHEPEPINLPRLRRAVGMTNIGSDPSDAHLLLRDSRAAARRGQFRRAVIDAGSSTELVLADFNRQATQVNTGPRPTLGWYVDQPAIVSRAMLPVNTKSDLVVLRNDSIHSNRIPTRAEVIRAISIADQVVKRLDPLPI